MKFLCKFEIVITAYKIPFFLKKTSRFRIFVKKNILKWGDCKKRAPGELRKIDVCD
jgi:hypothetical protein